MNRTGFQNENVANFISENVIAVKVDIDQSMGKLWQDEFNVQAIPTLIFFDQFGNEIYRECSGMSGSKLLTLLTSMNNGAINFGFQKVTTDLVSHNPNITIETSKKIRDINHFTRTIPYSKEDRFEIEVGNYFTQNDINRKFTELNSKFEQHRFYIVQRTIPSGTIFQLVLSGFESVYDAKFASEYLTTQDYEPQLVKL